MGRYKNKNMLWGGGHGCYVPLKKNEYPVYTSLWDLIDANLP
jgi:hypothetical protein